jgi:hypothetical protein
MSFDPKVVREFLPLLEGKGEDAFIKRAGGQYASFAEWWKLSDQNIRKIHEGEKILFGDQMDAYREWFLKDHEKVPRGELICFIPRMGWETLEDRQAHIKALFQVLSKIGCRYTVLEDPQNLDFEEKVIQGLVLPPVTVQGYLPNQKYIQEFARGCNIAFFIENLEDGYHGWSSILKYSSYFEGVKWEKDKQLETLISRVRIAEKVLNGEKPWTFRVDVSQKKGCPPLWVTVLSEYDQEPPYLAMEISGKTITGRLGKMRKQEDLEWFDVIVEVDGVIYNEALLREANRAPYYPVCGKNNLIHKAELERVREIKSLI